MAARPRAPSTRHWRNQAGAAGGPGLRLTVTRDRDRPLAAARAALPVAETAHTAAHPTAAHTAARPGMGPYTEPPPCLHPVIVPVYPGPRSAESGRAGRGDHVTVCGIRGSSPARGRNVPALDLMSARAQGVTVPDPAAAAVGVGRPARHLNSNSYGSRALRGLFRVLHLHLQSLWPPKMQSTSFIFAAACFAATMAVSSAFLVQGSSPMLGLRTSPALCRVSVSRPQVRLFSSGLSLLHRDYRCKCKIFSFYPLIFPSQILLFPSYVGANPTADRESWRCDYAGT